MRAALFALLALAIVPAGCATFAPEPCTDAWYDREAREAFAPIRRDLGPTIKRLRSASEAMEDPGLFTAVRFAVALENVARIVEAFDARTLPRLRLAADQCRDPTFVRRAVFDFLDEEGLDEIEPLANAFESSLTAR